MSLDVYLFGPEVEATCECDKCEHSHSRTVRERYFDANITHNLGSMAKAANEVTARTVGVRIRAATVERL